MKKYLISILFVLPQLSVAQPVQYIIPSNTQVPYLRVTKVDTLSSGSDVVVRQPSGFFAVVPASSFVTPSYTGFDSRYLPLSYAPSWNDITSKPPFSTVAFSADYNDLSNKPSLSITNWNLAYSWGNHAGLYAPLGRTISINGVVYDLNSNRSWNVFNGEYDSLLHKPNLSLYYLASNPNNYIVASALSPYATTTSLSAYLQKSDSILYQTKYRSDTARANIYTAINTKFNIPSGTTAQYVRGDGSLSTFPSIPSQVNITGGTNTKITGSYPNITVSDSLTTRIYNSSGLVNQAIKMWCDTVSPSTSNGYSINISSAGFTRVLAANVIAIRNTSTAATVPNAAIKSMTTTAITVNVVEDNPATISILGISVLSGLPSIFADVTGLKLAVLVTGY